MVRVLEIPTVGGKERRRGEKERRAEEDQVVFGFPIPKNPGHRPGFKLAQLIG